MTTSPQLEQFFGGYFHQDWNLDHSDWTDVVDLFKSESSPRDVLEVSSALLHLLQVEQPDAELEQFLHGQLGCYYTPRPDLGGPSVRAWLGQVLAVLEAGEA